MKRHSSETAHPEQQRSLRRSAITMTLAGVALATAGCFPGSGESADKGEVVERPAATIEEVQRLYREDLGINGNNMTVDNLELLGMSPDTLREDAENRTVALADVKEITVPSSVLYTPKMDMQDYAISHSPSTNYVFTDWAIKGADGLINYLPVARVSLDESGEAIVTDLRPPKVRLNSAEEIKYKTIQAGIISPAAETMEEALKAGVVSDYLITYTDEQMDFEAEFGADSAYFNSDTDEIVVTLPKHNPKRSDEVVSTISHESGHGYFSETDASQLTETVGTGPDVEQLRQACLEIKETALWQAGIYMYKLPPLLAQAKAMDPGLAEPIDLVIKAINTNTLEQYQYRNEGSWQNVELPECTLTNPLEMIGYVKTVILQNFEPASSTEQNDEKFKLYSDIHDTFYEAYRQAYIMKAISEHGYVTDKMTGHPEDGVDELAASLFTLATEYPDEFRRTVSYMPYDQAEDVKAAYASVRNLYIEKYPDLTDDLPALFEH